MGTDGLLDRLSFTYWLQLRLVWAWELFSDVYNLKIMVGSWIADPSAMTILIIGASGHLELFICLAAYTPCKTRKKKN